MGDKSEIKNKIIDFLSRIGVASLSHYIGDKKLERLYESGHTLDSFLLAEILYIEQGINLFKDKNIRLEILGSFGAEILRHTLQLDDPIIESLKKYNDYKWGNNSKSKEFLRLVELPEEKIFESRDKLESTKILSVKNRSEDHTSELQSH